MYVHNPHLKFLESNRKYCKIILGWQKEKYFFHLCQALPTSIQVANLATWVSLKFDYYHPSSNTPTHPHSPQKVKTFYYDGWKAGGQSDLTVKMRGEGSPLKLLLVKLNLRWVLGFDKKCSDSSFWRGHLCPGGQGQGGKAEAGNGSEGPGMKLRIWSCDTILLSFYHFTMYCNTDYYGD